MFAGAAAARPGSGIATANPDPERGGRLAVGRRVSRPLYMLCIGCAGRPESGIDLIGSRYEVSTSQIDIHTFLSGTEFACQFPLPPRLPSVAPISAPTRSPF